MQHCRWQILPDASSLAAAAAGRMLGAAERALRRRGEFHVVLAGGATPGDAYRLLRAVDTDWRAWHIYFGDERCLAKDDPLRNSSMAHDAWLAHVPIPLPQVHYIPAEQGAARAAWAYAQALRASPALTEDFDFVLLGLGEDGHTASLFPHHDWGDAPGSPDVIAVFDAPKPPPERVTLSAARLSRSREVMFVVDGEAKREAVADWRAGKLIPAHAITPQCGVDVLITQLLR